MSDYNILSRDSCHIFCVNGTQFCILLFSMTVSFFICFSDLSYLIHLFIFHLDILQEYLLKFISYISNDLLLI